MLTKFLSDDILSLYSQVKTRCDLVYLDDFAGELDKSPLANSALQTQPQAKKTVMHVICCWDCTSVELN